MGHRNRHVLSWKTIIYLNTLKPANKERAETFKRSTTNTKNNVQNREHFLRSTVLKAVLKSNTINYLESSYHMQRDDIISNIQKQFLN